MGDNLEIKIYTTTRIEQDTVRGLLDFLKSNYFADTYDKCLEKVNGRKDLYLALLDLCQNTKIECEQDYVDAQFSVPNELLLEIVQDISNKNITISEYISLILESYIKNPKSSVDKS